MTREQMAIEALRGIYHEACICNMDHGSACDCPAGDMAKNALDQLGVKP